MASRDYTRSDVIREEVDTTYWGHPIYTWHIEVEDGRQFERDSWRSAYALASLFDRFEKVDPPDKKEGFIPIVIALEGKPAIAAYLAGIHEMSREDIADRIEVAPTTVQKYLARFDPNRSSGNQSESEYRY